MEKNIVELEVFQEVVEVYGLHLLLALALLVAGLIAAKLAQKYLKYLLRRFILNEAMVATIVNVVFILIIMFVVIFALHLVGMHTIVVRRILIALILAAVGIVVVFRPLIPTLPFKVGNTIKVGDLLGKVEATTLLNTRLKTFDGKTVFVPNSKILNDFVINYHFTPNRRFEVDIGIRYDQDLLKAKQVLEALMTEDPRVLPIPRPVVYVTNLADNCVQLSGRGWIENVKYWKTKCDLLEKAKLRFDQEGIVIAYPQRDVHIYYETALPASVEQRVEDKK